MEDFNESSCSSFLIVHVSWPQTFSPPPLKPDESMQCHTVCSPQRTCTIYRALSLGLSNAIRLTGKTIEVQIRYICTSSLRKVECASALRSTRIKCMYMHLACLLCRERASSVDAQLYLVQKAIEYLAMSIQCRQASYTS